ncbi:MAG: N-acetylmuramoyl-L-alanine amidase [Saprospiraceae bacterium]
MNLHSIGIEICSNGYEYTAGQRVAVRNLVNDLIRKYEIPVTSIIRHLDYSAPRKRDV